MLIIIPFLSVDAKNKGSEIEDIVIVFKMHFDMGYTDWAEGVFQDYCGPMLKNTLKNINETYSLPKEEQFQWTVPGWPLQYIKDNCAEELRPSLEKALKQGRIVPHGLPFTYETEASDLETLVRGLKYSDEIRKSVNMDYARDAKLTDVPSHSSILPTLLSHAGIDFLHIGCNQACDAPKLPILSFWEGVDGKKILLFYWAKDYGSGLIPPDDWQYKSWLAIIPSHDNSGAPSKEEVAAVLKEAKEKYPNAHIRIGELKDFYDCVIKEKDKIPTIKGDMPDTWIHGFSSNPKATKISKQMHQLTYSTEALENLMPIWGVNVIDHSPEFKRAIEGQMLYDEHTFGAAILHGRQPNQWSFGDDFLMNKSLGNYEYLETSWREKQNRIENAERIIKPICKNHLKTIAKHVDVDGKKVIVYNSLPWHRSDKVTVVMDRYRPDKVKALKDLSTGKIIPVHQQECFIEFNASDVPPMGYKTFQVVDEHTSVSSSLKMDSLEYRIENKYYKIQVDKTHGTLISVFDKIRKKELVSGKYGHKMGQLIHELHGQKELENYANKYIHDFCRSWVTEEISRPYMSNREMATTEGCLKKIVCKQERNAVRIFVIGNVPNYGIDYVSCYTLYENQPYLELNYGINGMVADSRSQSLWVSFPFDIKSPQHRIQRIGNVVNPATDFIDNSNLFYCYTNGSVALFDPEGVGVAVDNPDAPGISFDETGLYQFEEKHTPQTSMLYVNLCNTKWGTNFTEWIEGSFSAKFRIRSFDNYGDAESITIPSIENRNPLVGAYSATKSEYENLPMELAGISVDVKGVYVTAFTSVEKGKILRLWDQTGEDQDITVTLPQNHGFESAMPCDLRGRAISEHPMKIQNNRIKLKGKANSPISLLLK